MATRILSVAFVVYLAVVACGTFGPAPGEELDEAARRAKVAQRAVTGEQGDGSAREASPRFAGLSGEELGNVAMFVPFGLVAPLLVPDRRWRYAVIPAGIALSGLIELVQWTVAVHRTPQLADVGWNGLGTVIGFVLWWVGDAVWRRRPGRG